MDALLHPWRKVTKRNPAFPFTQPFGTTGLLTKSHGLPRVVNEQGDSSPPTTFFPLNLLHTVDVSYLSELGSNVTFSERTTFLTIQPNADPQVLCIASCFFILTAVLISVVLSALSEHKTIHRDKQGLHFFLLHSHLLSPQYLLHRLLRSN